MNIPAIYRRIICSLWKGHNYICISPEYQSKILCKCTYCRKEKVFFKISYGTKRN